MSGQSPKPEDFYQQYVREKRARDASDKISTLVMPQQYMAALSGLLDQVMSAAGRDGLPPEQLRVWQAIKRQVDNAVVTAE